MAAGAAARRAVAALPRALERHRDRADSSAPSLPKKEGRQLAPTALPRFPRWSSAH